MTHNRSLVKLQLAAFNFIICSVSCYGKYAPFDIPKDDVSAQYYSKCVSMTNTLIKNPGNVLFIKDGLKTTPPTTVAGWIGPNTSQNYRIAYLYGAPVGCCFGCFLMRNNKNAGIEACLMRFYDFENKDYKVYGGTGLGSGICKPKTATSFMNNVLKDVTKIK